MEITAIKSKFGEIYNTRFDHLGAVISFTYYAKTGKCHTFAGTPSDGYGHYRPTDDKTIISKRAQFVALVSQKTS